MELGPEVRQPEGAPRGYCGMECGRIVALIAQAAATATTATGAKDVRPDKHISLRKIVGQNLYF